MLAAETALETALAHPTTTGYWLFVTFRSSSRAHRQKSTVDHAAENTRYNYNLVILRSIVAPTEDSLKTTGYTMPSMYPHAIHQKHTRVTTRPVMLAPKAQGTVQDTRNPPAYQP